VDVYEARVRKQSVLPWYDIATTNHRHHVE
jgi:hypothetical protein